MHPRPSVIVFDVNETLSDMAPLAKRFADIGAPEWLAKIWLNVYPDVPDGICLLHRHGLRLVTLSNGSAGMAARLLTRAGIRDQFEQLLSVEEAGAWKPVPSAYAYAARACSVAIEQMLLVAVHPWDIHGASQAGMRTGWLTRRHEPYPGYFAAPDLQAPDLSSLAGQIATPGG